MEKAVVINFLVFIGIFSLHAFIISFLFEIHTYIYIYKRTKFKSLL